MKENTKTFVQSLDNYDWKTNEQEAFLKLENYFKGDNAFDLEDVYKEVLQAIEDNTVKNEMALKMCLFVFNTELDVSFLDKYEDIEKENELELQNSVLSAPDHDNDDDTII
tara:strand:+ start:12858 stop:13190 length:333 start_codon:yes stop_codon:yes gene_type:complete